MSYDVAKCADTVVGSPGLVRGISGGERKRTNVALSLLGNPSLLLLAPLKSRPFIYKWRLIVYLKALKMSRSGSWSVKKSMLDDG